MVQRKIGGEIAGTYTIADGKVRHGHEMSKRGCHRAHASSDAIKRY